MIHDIARARLCDVCYCAGKAMQVQPAVSKHISTRLSGCHQSSQPSHDLPYPSHVYTSRRESEAMRAYILMMSTGASSARHRGQNVANLIRLTENRGLLHRHMSTAPGLPRKSPTESEVPMPICQSEYSSTPISHVLHGAERFSADNSVKYCCCC